MYPTAQFIRSYDAGRGQRFYIFATQSSFTDVVNYYRNLLKQRGELVFERPATQFFENGRFREESMAVSPGVTVKDFTATGLGGVPNPTAGATPAAFATVIQIVPARRAVIGPRSLAALSTASRRSRRPFRNSTDFSARPVSTAAGTSAPWLAA